MPIMNTTLSLPDCPANPIAASLVPNRPSHAFALTLVLTLAPGLAPAAGLWDRVKEGAAKSYERGADLVNEGAEQAGSIAIKGLDAAGAVVTPGLEYGKKLTKDAVDHFDRPGTPEEIRARVDRMAADSLERLFKQDPDARGLFDRSYGYAVFEVRQASLAVTAGYGYGVAVANGAAGAGETQRIYMKMLTGGLELSKGTEGLASEWVVLLEDEPSFRAFVEKGFDASAEAGGKAGTFKKGVATRFRKDMSVFRVDKGGLKLAASLTGTRFWPDSALNPPPPPAPVVELPAQTPAAAEPISAESGAEPAPAETVPATPEASEPATAPAQTVAPIEGAAGPELDDQAPAPSPAMPPS